MSKDFGVEVELALGHHDAVAFAKGLGPDGYVLGEKADRGGGGGDADCFVPGTVKSWAVVDEVVDIDASFGKSWLDLFTHNLN